MERSVGVNLGELNGRGMVAWYAIARLWIWMDGQTLLCVSAGIVRTCVRTHAAPATSAPSATPFRRRGKQDSKQPSKQRLASKCVGQLRISQPVSCVGRTGRQTKRREPPSCVDGRGDLPSSEALVSG